MKKRVLSWLLICVLCLALLPAGALADEDPAPAAEEAVAAETVEETAVEESAAGEDPVIELMLTGAEAAVPEEAEALALDGTEPLPGWPPPVIVTQPHDTAVSEGETAVFQVVANSATGSELLYKWEYSWDGASWKGIIEDWDVDDYDLETYPTLYVSARPEYDGLRYRCFVLDMSVGSVVMTNVVTLTVNKAISITKQPQNVTVTAGDRAVFNVSAAGSDLSYQWQYYNGYTGAWADIAGATYATMYFAAQTSYNGIYYHCVITDGSGNSAVTNYVKLTVNSTLAITSQPQDVNVNAGDWAVFTVGAEGAGLSYRWQYYNAVYKTWLDIAGATYATMYFTAKSGYSGIYYHCVVTDRSGASVTSNYVKLTVSGSLAILSQPTNKDFDVGQWAVFTISAAGSGLSYQWQYYSTYYGSWVNISGATYPMLRFIIRDAYQNIWYRCVVTDDSSDWIVSNYVTFDIVTFPAAEEYTEAMMYRLVYDTHFENGAVIPLSIIKMQDTPLLHTSYTGVRYEADGFEVLSQKTVDSGEDFLVRISPDLPADRAAVLKLTVLRGDKTLVTLHLYGIRTERGVYVSYNSFNVWSFYYRDRYDAGEFTEFQYMRISSAIGTASEPILEDPVKAAGLA